MSIYFDFKTIRELVDNEQYREQKKFTLDELSQYDGSNGKPAYVSVNGIVYDVSKEGSWSGGTHHGIFAGKDLTNQLNSCHGMAEILDNAPIVGILSDNYDVNDFFMSMNRQAKQDTSKFTPDDWIRYITPLVSYALRESNQSTMGTQGSTMGTQGSTMGTQGTDMQRLYQRITLMGVLVGLGKTPQEAINQVQNWQNSGASQLLKGGMGTTTGGGMGTTTGGGMGTTTGGGTGTTTGGGTGTTTGGGTGTTTGGSTGTGGFGPGSGMGAGGFGTGTGGFGSGSGMGAGGFGTGTGSFGSGSGMGTGGSTGTNTRNGSSTVNKRNRLYYE
ncbi:cytochrome b5-like heme/steroid binding domain protein [Clostridium saccharobutylicum]|uniref:cytochrome b5 domain-containing protein n=1 Tax=Clostridium saccharobutylicum TaxID=169679 RepID=UPI00098C62F8|nr:cytochrome b5 domain-containing protein [Clostridium saccharobutylicum]OOM16812.1 cytochrome b5-like heme/steroid binding domain protein [Clostridium saccharobutylicum]